MSIDKYYNVLVAPVISEIISWRQVNQYVLKLQKSKQEDEKMLLNFFYNASVTAVQILNRKKREALWKRRTKSVRKAYVSPKEDNHSIRIEA